MDETHSTRRNFLITGFGRSGTKFLATMLNKSPTWTVAHEPSSLSESLPQVIPRFKRDHYGEVNSHLRHLLPKIQARRKAIVLRDPHEIAVSVFNRHGDATPSRLEGVWELLDSYVAEGYETFRFEQFTRGIEALYAIARWAGIDDLRLSPDVVNHPINATSKNVVSCYADLPNEVLARIDRGVSWFRKKYFG